MWKDHPKCIKWRLPLVLESAASLSLPTPIFPQLWNPCNLWDLWSNLPDLSLGSLIPPDGHLYIQGGAEHKKPILPLLSGLPPPATILSSPEACDVLASAIKQASDQVKAVIKNGAAPQDEVISWIIPIGPYFIVKSFNQAELDTWGHRPNPSGDAQVAEAIEKAIEQDRNQIMEPIHLIDTAAAATAMEEFLQNGRQLYTSNNRMMWLVPL